MTGTDEAVLIEIAQRFRRLEDLIEQADLYHQERVERAKERIERVDAAHSSGKINYATFCSLTNEAEKTRDEVEEMRQELDRALEACRDDMVTMQEQIRR